MKPPKFKAPAGFKQEENLQRALHKLNVTQGGQGYCSAELTPSECLALSQAGCKGNWAVAYQIKKIASGESSPTWCRFQLSKKVMKKLPPSKRNSHGKKNHAD